MEAYSLVATKAEGEIHSKEDDGACDGGQFVLEDDGYFGVEKILASKWIVKRGRPRQGEKMKQRVYLVRWKNYSADHDTWEPEDNLRHLQVFLDYQAMSGNSTEDGEEGEGKVPSKRKRNEKKKKRKRDLSFRVFEYGKEDGETEEAEEIEKQKTKEGRVEVKGKRQTKKKEKRMKVGQIPTEEKGEMIMQNKESEGVQAVTRAETTLISPTNGAVKIDDEKQEKNKDTDRVDQVVIEDVIIEEHSSLNELETSRLNVIYQQKFSTTLKRKKTLRERTGPRKRRLVAEVIAKQTVESKPLHYEEILDDKQHKFKPANNSIAHRKTWYFGTYNLSVHVQRSKEEQTEDTVNH